MSKTKTMQLLTQAQQKCWCCWSPRAHCRVKFAKR